MASLWFAWTFDARTAGLGALQNVGQENMSDTSSSVSYICYFKTTTCRSNNDHVLSSDMVPSASPAARSEMRTAGSASGSASAGTSPVLCRRDTALTQSDPVKVSSDDPLRPDPAMDRTDSVMVMGDLETPGDGSGTPRTSMVSMDLPASRCTAVVSDTEAVAELGESTATEPETETRGGAVAEITDPHKTNPATDRSDLLRENAIIITKGSTQRTTTVTDTVMSEAVTFLGLLRHHEDQLVQRMKQLLKRDRHVVQLMFCTLVDHWTPVHACTLRGARKLLKMALKCGVSPDLEMGEPEGLPGRCSPLHLAAYRGDVSLLQVLVQGGATLSKRDGALRTPLFYAASSHNTLAARKLIKYGADPSDLTPEQRAFYKEDIDRRPASILCMPVQSGDGDQ
ncbi:hypothetical protein ACOMHN_015949 [Nucella lapillus]